MEWQIWITGIRFMEHADSCGECLEVKVDDKWVKTRMEMDIDRNWYLVDTPIQEI